MPYSQTGPNSEPQQSIQTFVPKIDMMNLENVPDAVLNVEVRANPEKPRDAAMFAATRVLRVSLMLALAVIVLRVLGNVIGDWASSPAVFPLWVGLASISAVSRFLKAEGWFSIAQGMMLPLSMPLVFKLERLSQGDAAARLSAVAISVVLICYCADQIANHFHRWLTAHAGIGEHEREEMRARWRRRLVSRYVLNIAIAMLPFLLLEWTNLPSETLFLVMPLTALGWVFRPRTISLSWGVLGTLRAFASFLSWGRWEQPMGTPAPGVFRSPAGPAVVRWALAFATFTGASIVFSPPLAAIVGAFEAGAYFKVLTGVIRLVLLPATLLLSASMIVAGRELGNVAEDIDWRLGDEDGTACFLQISEELRKSPDKLVREHFYLGQHYHCRYPVFLHDKILWDHGHIEGGSGSGKTTRGILPLIKQLIDRGNCSVIVADLKGTPSFAQGVFKLAGARCKFVTTEPGKATYVFNPLRQLYSSGISLNQICEIVLEALNLVHGTNYGRGYYSEMSRLLLSDIIHTYPNIRTFHELFEYLRLTPPRGADGEDARRVRNECMHLISLIQSLAMRDLLNWQNVPGARPESLRDQVHLPDIIKNNQVVFFEYPSSREPILNRMLAQLTVYAAYEAAREARASGKHVYFFIDEFQNAVSRGFERFMRECRNFNMHLILCNQSPSDLKTEDAPNLAAIVQQNTQFKQYFSASEQELQEMLVRTSGLTLGLQYGVSIAGLEERSIMESRSVRQGNGEYRTFDHKVGSSFSKVRKGEEPAFGETFSAAEKPVERMNINDVLAYSSDPEASIVQFGKDSGYTLYGGHWFAIRSPYVMSLREWEYLEKLGWPEQTASTIVTGTRSRLYRSFFRREARRPPTSPITPKPSQAEHLKRVKPHKAGNNTRPQETSKPQVKHSTAQPQKAFWLERLRQIAEDQEKGGTV